MKRTVQINPFLGLVLVLVMFAAVLTIPVIAFYVLPKALVWCINWIIGFLGWHIPFNLFTWALAMYVLYLLGVVRFATKELKSAVNELKTK
jgi:hypothetical protein